jgi:quercetin dioxygenase-like cupin family protein
MIERIRYELRGERKMTQATSATKGFFKLTEVEPIELAPGIKLRLISGDKGMMSYVYIEPGAIVPLHSHPHEQMGTVLEGEMYFYLGSMNEEDRRLMKAGDVYIAPGGVPHAATSAHPDKHVVALDFFSPPREDYIAKFTEITGKPVTGHQ